MAEENKVEDTERVEVKPAEGETEAEPAEKAGEETPDEGTETEGEKPETEPEETEVPADDNKDEKDTQIKDVPGETPSEKALRLEVTRVKGLLRKERLDDIPLNENAPVTVKREPSAHTKEVLAKYKPEEINSLKEVLPILAEEMGFVRKDELGASNYAEKSQEQLDTFLDKHPEYSQENDTKGILWNAFKTEFGLYKQPTNPKDYARIFEKVHQSVFGIKTGGPLPKVNAQQRKANVASHAGASGPSGNRQEVRRTVTTGLRTDMLKGFDESDIADIESRAGGQ
jgi:hypothetical protein